MKTNATPEAVCKMFPGTPSVNIRENLPYVLAALEREGIDDVDMVLMALATIRAETGCFRPIDEGESKWNTTPGGPHPFDRYDSMNNLGNLGVPDGDRFKGRGFIQLTGRANYDIHGRAIGVDLISNPSHANDPDIAARLLASFLKAHEPKIRAALAAGDLAAARKLVNGGSHGLEEFSKAYKAGESLITQAA